MRLLFLVLFVLLGLIQYPLWMGKGGWFVVWDLQRQVAAQKETNEGLPARAMRRWKPKCATWMGHRRCRGTCARRAGHDAGRRGLRAYPAAERHAAGGRRIAGHRGGRQARRHAGPRRLGRAGQAGCRRGSVAGQARRQPIRFGRASLIALAPSPPWLTSRTGRGVIGSAACGRLPTPCPRAMVASATNRPDASASPCPVPPRSAAGRAPAPGRRTHARRRPPGQE